MIRFDYFKINENETLEQVLARFDSSQWKVISDKAVLVTAKYSPKSFWTIYFVKFDTKFKTLKAVSDAVRDLGFDFANAASLASLNLEDPTISSKFPNLTLWQSEQLDVFMMSFVEIDSGKRVFVDSASDINSLGMGTKWVACQSQMSPFTSNLIK
jgi:hypothetical protein